MEEPKFSDQQSLVDFFNRRMSNIRKCKEEIFEQAEDHFEIADDAFSSRKIFEQYGLCSTLYFMSSHVARSMIPTVPSPSYSPFGTNRLQFNQRWKRR